jgi:hypothetical protein
VIVRGFGCCLSPKIIVIREVEIESFAAGFQAFLEGMVVVLS